MSNTGAISYSTREFLASVEDASMPVSTKLIRDSLLEGTYPGKLSVFEDSAEITSISLVKEPYGQGVSVKQSDGHEYRYAADDSSQKYDTPDKLATAAQKLLKFRSSGAVLGWLSKNGILYFGSKKGANAAFPKGVKEELSKEASNELRKIIKELHPEWDEDKIQGEMFAFLETNDISSDWEFYGMSPQAIKKSLS